MKINGIGIIVFAALMIGVSYLESSRLQQRKSWNTDHASAPQKTADHGCSEADQRLCRFPAYTLLKTRGLIP